LTAIGEADVVKKNRSVQTQGKEPGATSRRDRRRNMTTTTTGTNGFPVRYLVTAVVAAALAAVIIAISQQAGTDIVQTVSVPKQATSEAVAPSASANGLNDALANGKFDSGFGQTDASTAAAGTPVPTTVEISGQGGLYDALIAGKLRADFGPNTDVRYVRGSAAASGGLAQDLAGIGFDAAPVNSSKSAANTPAPRIVEISGQGGLHDALVAGKLTMDSKVQYVGTAEKTTSGTVQAWNDGNFDESATDTQPSPASTHSPAISGGYQE
jgi:hypothetical protein